MYHKISNTVGKYAKAYGQSSPEPIILPSYKTCNTHCCIEYKKQVITLPPAFVVFMMMIFMHTHKNPCITYLCVAHAINSMAEKVPIKVKIQSSVVIFFNLNNW